jgi:hypothetical protein
MSKKMMIEVHKTPEKNLKRKFSDETEKVIHENKE